MPEKKTAKKTTPRKTAAAKKSSKGITAEEREPSPSLCVFDRLEEEARRVTLTGADELHERGDGRLEVGKNLPPDGHDSVLAGQRDELVARDAESHHTGPGVAPLPKARKKQLRSPV